MSETNNKLLYFDNCATTKIDDDVLQIVSDYAKNKFFNPSARSSLSLEVSNDLAVARRQIARLVGADEDEIFFTSGGTESNNIAILAGGKSRKGNVVVTAAEHSSVYNPVMQLAGKGYEIRIAKVLPDGHIDVDDFVNKVDENTALACFMHVNNETGAINDVRRINALVKQHAPKCHTLSDGVQAVGKIPVNIHSLGVDFYSMSGHKIHGSKGSGFLYVRRGTKCNPLVFGGGQEHGMRSGTEFVGGQIALATALAKATKLVNDPIFGELRNTVTYKLQQIANYKILCNTDNTPRILTAAFADIKGEVLVHMLEKYNIVVGTGSACSSANKQSRVAKAIGLEPRYTEGIIRISFTDGITVADADFLADKLVQCVAELRKTMGV